MLSLLAALAFLAATGALGMRGLRWLDRSLTPVELVAYGVPLGTIVATLALLALASSLGHLTALLVVAIGIASAGGALALTVRSTSDSARGLGLVAGHSPWSTLDVSHLTIAGRAKLTEARAALGLGSALVAGGLFFLIATFALGATSNRSSGLWVGHQHVWSDWPLHLSHTTSFADGDNVPPSNPLVSGEPFSYHYLSSLTAAALVKLGLTPTTALELHTLVYAALAALGIYAFARRLGLGQGGATLAAALFVLGGGLDWTVMLGRLDAAGGALSTLWKEPFDYPAVRDANFRWETVFIQLLVPTRGFLYGLPIALLVFTLLMRAMEGDHRRRFFIAAGAAAALLPYAHLGTLQALALIAPAIFMIQPRRDWLWFFGVWVAGAAPQIYLQQGGETGAVRALRWHVGWLAGADPIWWFWLKNLGWFIPLLVLALLDRDLLPARSRRVLWTFMPVFLIANLIVFQPLELDNNKILTYWFIAVCVLVAALLADTWRRYRAIVVRGLVAAVTLSLILSGLLMHLDQMRGNDTYMLLGREEIELAAAVRDGTPTDALFATAPVHNHPVAMLAGRRIVMPWFGWLVHWGMPYDERTRDLATIYAYGPDAPALIERYGIDYVVIGPMEREELEEIDVAAFASRYPVAVATEHYQVFAVGAGSV